MKLQSLFPKYEDWESPIGGFIVSAVLSAVGFYVAFSSQPLEIHTNIPFISTIVPESVHQAFGRVFIGLGACGTAALAVHAFRAYIRVVKEAAIEADSRIAVPQKLMERQNKPEVGNGEKPSGGERSP